MLLFFVFCLIPCNFSMAPVTFQCQGIALCWYLCDLEAIMVNLAYILNCILKYLFTNAIITIIMVQAFCSVQHNFYDIFCNWFEENNKWYPVKMGLSNINLTYLPSHASAHFLTSITKNPQLSIYDPILVLVGEICQYMYVPLFTKCQKDSVSLFIWNETPLIVLYINQQTQTWWMLETISFVKQKIPWNGELD